MSLKTVDAAEYLRPSCNIVDSNSAAHEKNSRISCIYKIANILLWPFRRYVHYIYSYPPEFTMLEFFLCPHLLFHSRIYIYHSLSLLIFVPLFQNMWKDLFG